MRFLAAGAALACARAALAATPPPPGGIPDIVDARTLALGASIGALNANEGIFVNPAAIAARKRYSVEAMGLLDRRGASNEGMFFGASVADSMTSPIAAGFAYTRDERGDYTGNDFRLSLAGPVSGKLYLGATGKYFSLHGTAPVSAATADAGLFWEVNDVLSIGAAGYNLVPIDKPQVAPMAAGAGLAIGSDRTVRVSADWRGDFDRAGKTTNRYSVGLETLIVNLVPLRAGYVKDETLATSWWSVGAGVVSQGGVAFDVGYRQSVTDPSARTIAASLKVFLFE